jgi:hypothetical protein
MIGILSSCSQKEDGKNRVIMLYTNVDTCEPVFYEIGKIEAGSSTEFILNLKNTRQSPVVISEARSFCGCTIPEYKPKPVPPGECSSIKITFFAEHLGLFDKAVRVYLSHQEEPIELRFRGEVIRNKKNMTSVLQ